MHLFRYWSAVEEFRKKKIFKQIDRRNFTLRIAVFVDSGHRPEFLTIIKHDVSKTGYVSFFVLREARMGEGAFCCVGSLSKS
jgi:hypothetical protein